jgi:hypothetical protein
MRSLFAFALALVLTIPAVATAAPPRRLADRPTAERALTRAQRIADGRGVRTGRELSAALRAVAQRLPALSAADRTQAEALLARPTDPNDHPGEGGPYTTSTVGSKQSAHFCAHWVETTADAVHDNDTNVGTVPAYITSMLVAFETVYATENGTLGWAAPKADGTLGNTSGCTGGKTDVYAKDIGTLGLYGYASPDAGQGNTTKSRYAYLVMDNDYSASEFPQYSGDATAPMEVTAAHEYNHVLQYGYDTFADTWMFESSATWMEEQVFPAIDDYHQYLNSWAHLSRAPITLADAAKMYGSAVWNHWLSGRYGPTVVRRAWELSNGFTNASPQAYDQAIREAGGPGFSAEQLEFSANTAEWGAGNSGIHEGFAFPAVDRVAGPDGNPLVISADGTAVSGLLDHTTFALFPVAVPANAQRLDLTGTIADGTPGGIALIGYAGGQLTRAVGRLDTGGRTVVSLPDPGRFERVTAVVVNADYGDAGFDGSTGDWAWTGDGRETSLSATAVVPAPVVTTPPPVVTTAAATLSLGSGTLPRLRALARNGGLPFRATVNGAGRLRVVATVDKATAKRLKVGRKKTTVGRATTTVTKAGRVTVKVKLTKKARTGLKRQRRTLRIALRVTFTPASGAAPTTKKLSLLLRP